jgi:hypothetical protein
MVKSPAHFEQPNTSKGKAATQERDLKPGKSDLQTPRDMDWHKAGKEQGLGFSNNPVSVLVRGDNPSAQEYRRPSEHNYRQTGAGGNSGEGRVRMQNILAGKRK